MKKQSVWWVMGTVAAVAAGCSKPEAPPPGAEGTPASSAAAAGASAVAVETAPAVEEPSAAPLGPVPSRKDFEAGTKVTVENAVGVGCETKTSGAWLELLCYDKNGTGGRPVRAHLPPLGIAEETLVEEPAADGGPGVKVREITPEESGILRVVVPWREGHVADGAIDWTDTRFELHVDGESARLAWDSTIPMRKACAALEQDARTLVDAAVKRTTPDAPTRDEVRKLPKFGRCQPAGFGSWAVNVTELGAAGEGAARELRAALEVAWVDLAGKVTRAPMATVRFAPRGFTIPRLVVFDYDADGKDELIVTHELEGTTEASPKALPAIWKYDGAAVAPYGAAPALPAGGLVTEQLDRDMRPDLGTWGPFVAWLGPGCGGDRCPTRLVGPRLFVHATKDGSFATDDDTVRDAAKRACSAKPTQVVAPGNPADLTRTATNVGCARLWGIDTATITAELDANREKLCGAAGSCEVLAALTRWASAAPPFTLGS